MSSAEIHVPKGIAFTCHNSGVCCRVFDSIPVNDSSQMAIAAIDKSMLNARAGNPAELEPVITSPERDEAPRLARKQHNGCQSCALLTEDNLCAVHALAGEAAKPRACQDFPWRYVETPGGVYVGLSFVCPSVRQNRGQLLEEQSAQIQERYTRSASIREAVSSLQLNLRRSITWNDYLAIESALRELLALTDEPLPLRLQACCHLPGFIDSVLGESGTVQRLHIRQIIDAMRSNGFSHLMQVVRKSAGHRQSPRPRRMFLGMLASFANSLQRRQNAGRLETVAAVMHQYFRCAVGLGGMKLRPPGITLSLPQLDKALLPENGPVASQITRYIDHCLSRKDLVLSGDINHRMRLLAVNAALVGWYAAAYAKQSGGTDTEPQHWDDAIGAVERLYGFHSTFYQFFERNKTFSDLVDSFLLKPAFPKMLLG